jgi:hypothetical protein
LLHYFIGKRRVFWRVEAQDASTQHCNRAAARFECRSVRCPVNSAGEATNDG